MSEQMPGVIADYCVCCLINDLETKADELRDEEFPPQMDHDFAAEMARLIDCVVKVLKTL